MAHATAPSRSLEGESPLSPIALSADTLGARLAAAVQSASPNASLMRLHRERRSSDLLSPLPPELTNVEEVDEIGTRGGRVLADMEADWSLLTSTSAPAVSPRRPSFERVHISFEDSGDSTTFASGVDLSIGTPKAKAGLPIRRPTHGHRHVVAGPFQGHSGWLNSVAFSPGGKRVVSGSSDNTIRVWDAETGDVVAGPFQGHSDWANSVAFSPDGKRVVSGSLDNTIRVWDAETGDVVAGPFQGHSEWVNSVAFSPDGMRVVSGSSDNTIRVWDAETGDVVAGPFQGHSRIVWSVAFSPDGKRVVSGSSDNTIRVWDAETGEVAAGPFQGHSGTVWSVAFSPDGKRVVSGSSDNIIRVWDAETGDVAAGPFQGHSDWVNSVAFSPDGKRVVSGSSDNTIRVWDAETGDSVDTVSATLALLPVQKHSSPQDDDEPLNQSSIHKFAIPSPATGAGRPSLAPRGSTSRASPRVYYIPKSSNVDEPRRKHSEENSQIETSSSVPTLPHIPFPLPTSGDLLPTSGDLLLTSGDLLPLLPFDYNYWGGHKVSWGRLPPVCKAQNFKELRPLDSIPSLRCVDAELARMEGRNPFVDIHDLSFYSQYYSLFGPTEEAPTPNPWSGSSALLAPSAWPPTPGQSPLQHPQSNITSSSSPKLSERSPRRKRSEETSRGVSSRLSAAFEPNSYGYSPKNIPYPTPLGSVEPTPYGYPPKHIPYPTPEVSAGSTPESSPPGFMPEVSAESTLLGSVGPTPYGYSPKHLPYPTPEVSAESTSRRYSTQQIPYPIPRGSTATSPVAHLIKAEKIQKQSPLTYQSTPKKDGMGGLITDAESTTSQTPSYDYTPRSSFDSTSRRQRLPVSPVVENPSFMERRLYIRSLTLSTSIPDEYKALIERVYSWYEKTLKDSRAMQADSASCKGQSYGIQLVGLNLQIDQPSIVVTENSTFSQVGLKIYSAGVAALPVALEQTCGPTPRWKLPHMNAKIPCGLRKLYIADISVPFTLALVRDGEEDTPLLIPINSLDAASTQTVGEVIGPCLKGKATMLKSIKWLPSHQDVQNSSYDSFWKGTGRCSECNSLTLETSGSKPGQFRNNHDFPTPVPLRLVIPQCRGLVKAAPRLKLFALQAIHLSRSLLHLAICLAEAVTLSKIEGPTEAFLISRLKNFVTSLKDIFLAIDSSESNSLQDIEQSLKQFFDEICEEQPGVVPIRQSFESFTALSTINRLDGATSDDSDIDTEELAVGGPILITAAERRKLDFVGSSDSLTGSERESSSSRPPESRTKGRRHAGLKPRVEVPEPVEERRRTQRLPRDSISSKDEQCIIQ